MGHTRNILRFLLGFRRLRVRYRRVIHQLRPAVSHYLAVAHRLGLYVRFSAFLDLNTQISLEGHTGERQMSEGCAAVHTTPAMNHALYRVNNLVQNNKEPPATCFVPMKVSMGALLALLPRTPCATFTDEIFQLLCFRRQRVGLFEFGHGSGRMCLLLGGTSKRCILLFSRPQRQRRNRHSSIGAGYAGSLLSNGTAGYRDRRLAGSATLRLPGRVLTNHCGT